MTQSAFRDHIHTVVEDFLETALVVDDEGLPRARLELETPAVDEDAGRARSRINLRLEVPSEAALAAPEEFHPLNTKELLDAFADVGVVCSVLAPLKDDQIQERVLKAAARSDLLILDWELHRDGGTTARQLIQAVLKQDAEGDRRRLRVIAIYTGQTRLKRIVELIRRALKFPLASLQEDDMVLVQDHVRIAAFIKPVEKNVRQELLGRQVSEADLPKRLTNEFAQLTNGLVPAVALAALTAIRSDTHRVLQALRKDVDIGYLGHRVASSFPADAEGHLVDMVAAEIASILSNSDVGRHADIDVIRSWLAQERSGSEPLLVGSALTLKKSKSFSEQQVDTMLTSGLGLDEQLKVQGEPSDLSPDILGKVRRQAAHLFTNDAVIADASADIFGMRMAVRTVYTRPRRMLRLGTVVRYRGDYLICVQPRCDSVRLDPQNPRSFPFLPLRVASETSTHHEFVVKDPDNDALVRLRPHVRPFSLSTWRFPCAADTRTVEARVRAGIWAFYNTSNHRFLWVAELKPDFAQRIAANLASEIARVGLSESELVRLSAD